MRIAVGKETSGRSPQHSLTITLINQTSSNPMNKPKCDEKEQNALIHT